ncbi:hypothetical protein ACIGEP_16645 [Microbacterium sp. NPDC077663]|uniref:hypothetical protein n=1 Tax=Microbacterium sp. NPDC077663 TaxID=3364189 RepID=UPI0037C6D60C
MKQRGWRWAALSAGVLLIIASILAAGVSIAPIVIWGVRIAGVALIIAFFLPFPNRSQPEADASLKDRQP